jgi:hypothetical protein
VFLHASRYGQLQRRIAFSETSEGHVFTRVVKAVRVVTQVVDDHAHQLIVHAPTRMKSVYLPFNQIEKSCKVVVVSAPSGNRMGGRKVIARRFTAACFGC